MVYTLPKTALLRKTTQYNAVYQQGKRIRGHHFSLIVLENDQGYNRLGISVHGVKTAVQRNRFKRIVREFFRLHRDFLPQGVDIVFAVRKECSLDSPQAVYDAVKSLFRQRKKRKT
jgi:ribonuclease P protein component